MVATIAYYMAAFLVGSLAVARITRMVFHDSFPPMAWVRSKWDEKTEGSQWNDLLHCPFCIAPYVTTVILAWAWFSDFGTAWWLFCVLCAGSYVAAMVVASDWG